MSVEYDAQSKVAALGIGGFILAVIGGFVAVQQWPETSLVTGEDKGNAVAAFLGLLACGLGQTAVFVAIVACGVRLGVRWSGLSDSLSAVARSTERAVVATSAVASTATGGVAAGSAGVVGSPPVQRRPGDLSGIEPLKPVADRSYMDGDGL